MGVALHLSALAVRSVVDKACAAIGVTEAGEKVVAYLAQRFSDHSRRLGEALEKANENAWKSLEIALAGESFWQRCQALLGERENHVFGRQMRAFLDAAPQAGFPQHPAAFRQQCLQDLRRARKAGLLNAEKPDPQNLARRVADFTRYADPQALIEAEWKAVEAMADDLRRAGCEPLGRFLALRPPDGPPLLVIAVRYFFRRQIEEDDQLARGLAYVQMERLAQAQEGGFAALAAALAREGQRLEELLADVQAIVVETHGAVLTLQEQIAGQSEQIRAVGEAVLRLLDQHQLQRRPLRPSDSLSMRNDADRHAVRQLAARFRALPEADQRRLPALLNGLGKLEVVAGDFEAAQHDFQKAAASAADAGTQAEAHYHAYQAALQRRDWAGAMKEFLAAVRLDAHRLAPFPVGKYHPQRILGAGGFGVAFLCQHKYMNAPVVIKALTGADLDQGVDRVFAEAMALRQMDHPAVIRIQDCGFADSSQKERPYLVMDYFEGATLEDEAGRQALPQEACLAVARQIAEGLQAAHARGILHRDVKPANVLVRKGPAGWQAKLIDFGLALNRSMLDTAKVSSKTLMGATIAGTMHYAAPEQMGLAPGVAVGPHSDVYGFGKTCCYALFQTPEPTLRHWQSIAPRLAELIGQCLERLPAGRPANFGDVLTRLAALRPDEPAAVKLEEDRRRRTEQERRLREAEARAEADSRRKDEERQLREAAARVEAERRRMEEQERRLREATEKAEAERRRLEEQQRQKPVEIEPILEVLPVSPRRPPPLPPRPPVLPGVVPASPSVGTIDVFCPHCRNRITVPTAWAGQQTPCPICRRTFTIPSPKRATSGVKSCLGCLVLLVGAVVVGLVATGKWSAVTDAIQGAFGPGLPTTPGAPIMSDSFRRSEISSTGLGQPEVGRYSYIVRGALEAGPFGIHIADGALQNGGTDSGAVEIATPGGRAANLGRDLNVSVDLLVPKDASTGAMSAAGPLLRAQAPGLEEASQNAVSGYWVSLNSMGQVQVQRLSASVPFASVIADSAPAASFEPTSWHTLEVRVHGDELQAKLGDGMVMFQQGGQPPTRTVKLGDSTDQTHGAAGLFFGTGDKIPAGGQKARNLKISVYQAFDAAPVPNSGAPPLGPVKPKDKAQ